MTASLRIQSSKADSNTWESFTRSGLKLESVHRVTTLRRLQQKGYQATSEPETTSEASYLGCGEKANLNHTYIYCIYIYIYIYIYTSIILDIHIYIIRYNIYNITVACESLGTPCRICENVNSFNKIKEIIQMHVIFYLVLS